MHFLSDSTLYCSIRETGGGAGSLLLEHLSYPIADYPEVCPEGHQLDEEDGEGVYTYKTHHPGDRLPWFVELFFPKSKLVMHEETFNSHPFFLATLTLPEFLGDKFCMTVKSKVVASRELAENTFHLSPEDLDKRKTTTLDIAGSEFESKKYEGERPDTFQSKRRTRGPLGENWRDSEAVLSVTLHLTSQTQSDWSR